MVGQTISHYRIEKEIGSGGMGVVYQAFDERLQRAVALKVLPDAISSHSERWARILAEARAASALNHPGITTIYEVGEDGEHLFLVMELLTGRTLREELHAGPIETRRLLRIGGQIADALAVAHEQGIVHGDIKPENIVLLPDGRVKLLDFGIARQIAAETLTVTRTQTHAWMGDSAIAGTLAYMAPEALRGESTDARADLFSLGIMLYEMAAGSRPFPGPTATALVAQIQNDAPAPLGRVAPGTPPELARVVGKLLQKEVTSRYQSVREVHVDLNNLARDLEVGASLPAAVAGKRAVAVLPFKLLTPNTEDEYLSVALADAIINQLGADGELLVRPTSTVLRYAKQANDPIAAARELNVNVVVDGSIQKFGQQLRVHVQAWDADDGSTIASAKHDSELTGLFALQDEIAGTLARALGSKAAAGKKKKEEPPTTNPMAYELYLRGVDRLMRLNRWDTRTAIEMLQNAVLLDPGFADAWARLGEGCVLMAGTFEPGPAWVARAERAVRKALSLDRLNAEAHVARGRLVWTPAKKFQHRTALRALRDALRYSPGTHQALVWSGCILMHIGLMEEAKESLLTALGTNPDDAFTLIFLAQANLYLGKYDDTDPYEERVLVQDRANLWANLFGGVAPLYRNDLAKAERFIRSAEQVLPGDPMLLACEGLLWAKRGEKKKAEPLLARAVRNPKSMLHTHHMVHMAAAAHAVLGQKQKALALLRKSAINGLPNYPMFANDPHFTPYHREPAFLKLMAELRKEWTGYVKEFGSKASAAKV